jgi:acetolactate synthase-1/2/3 large subunit
LLLPHSAKIVQVDPDAREFGRLQPVTQSLQADVSTTIEAMADAADGRVWKDRGAWLDRVDELVRRKHDTIAQTGNAADGLHPLEAVQTVARHVDGSTLLVADGALSYLWLSEIVSLARPKAFLCHGYLGCMGVGFGTAIVEQKTLSPGERAILVTGDGAVGYALADFDTLVRHHVPLIVVIMNNQSWGATQHFQKLLLGENRISGTMLQNGRYHEAAASFGVDAYYAENAAEFEAALTAALAKQVPACINVRVALAPIPPEEMLLLGLEESGGGIGNSANTA